MFQEMFVSLILEIEEKSERYMETGLKLGSARDDMKKAIGLANALSEKYGSKYSFEGKVVERLYSEEEIEEIKAELLDKSILTLIKRLLGFGKKTGEIYAELMGKLPIEKYNSITQQLKGKYPFVTEVEDGSCEGEGVTVYRVPKRYSDHSLAVHLVGLCGKNGGESGIERAYDEWLSDAAGELSVTCRVSASGRSLLTATFRISPRLPQKNISNAAQSSSLKLTRAK